MCSERIVELEAVTKNRCFRVLNLPILAGCDAAPGAIGWRYYSPFMNWTLAFWGRRFLVRGMVGEPD